MPIEEKYLVIFERKEIRRTWYNERCYFVVEDVVQALIESADTKQYIQRIKLRDPELAKGYVQFVHTLDAPLSSKTSVEEKYAGFLPV